MKLSDAFPSNYLKSDDLNGRDVTVVIAGATMEQIGSDRRLVLSFQNAKKTMICNKTNAGRIAYLYGDDTDGWVGREIVITSEFVEYQGKTVKGLRVKPPQQRQAEQPQRQHVVQQRAGYELSTTTQAPQPAGDPRDLDDPIPF